MTPGGSAAAGYSARRVSSLRAAGSSAAARGSSRLRYDHAIVHPPEPAP
jgi:hypothetical protein